MNRWIKTGMLVWLMLLTSILVGCKGDEGPAGPAGTATCMNCHTDNYGMEDNLLPIGTQYSSSLHATTSTYLRKTSPCAGCHTTEGYQSYVSTGTLPTTELPQSSHIGCFACHAPHTNESFAMRKTGATTMTVGGGTYDKQESNTCAMCHQSRVPSPNFTLATFTPDSVTSSRFGSHYCTQANVLSGQGLYVFPGGSAYPAGHSHNSISNGCVSCHMADVPGGAMVGGHSFAIAYMSGTSERINSKGCVGCHSSDMPNGDASAITYVDEVKHAFETALEDTLAVKLHALGLLKKNTDGSYSVNDKRLDGAGPKRKLWSKDELGAIFNYGALHYDGSGSVHNPVYARAVYNATLAWANAQ